MDKQSIQRTQKVPVILWHADQVMLTFHSSTYLSGTEGKINNGESILQQVDLEGRLPGLNHFLREHGIDYRLSFFERKGRTYETSSFLQHSTTSEQIDSGSKLPPGIYLFDVDDSPIKATFGKVATSVVSFFNFRNNQSKEASGTLTVSSLEVKLPLTTNDAGTFEQSSEIDPVARLVNLINSNLAILNHDLQIPISAASPVWFSGGTPLRSEGCPVTPPIAVNDTCALWRVKFPQQLAPQGLASTTGQGVSVFILDAFPDRNVISEAAALAGDDNQLLVDVNNNVTFNYSIPTPLITGPGSEPVSIGKDVYGHHSVMKMPDHGLFIAGLVRDVAPGATIECVRVLDEYCVGDIGALTAAFHYIAGRMSRAGDLYQRHVVINMSLILPSEEDARSFGLDPKLDSPDNNAYTGLRQQMQSLVDLGAIFVASAGNRGDVRTDPAAQRPAALYPAGFANSPYNMNGIIPVGAVDHNGNAASYSCYPGSRGIATYGGELPTVTPPVPSTDGAPISVTVTDALHGIYSSQTYPPEVNSEPEYAAPNAHAWAYWTGTSFAAPIVSALTARVLQLKSRGTLVANVHDAVIAMAGTNTTTWNRLDPVSTGISSGSVSGPVILAVQDCRAGDEDEVVD